MTDIKKYLDETNTVLLTREAYAELLKYVKAFEDIRTEIEAKAKEREFYMDSGHPYEGLREAIEIIDNHIGKEQEE